MKIGVDYDGTVVVALPEPGYCEVDTGAERVLGRLVSSGHELFLWTCRNESTDNPYNYIDGQLRGHTSIDEAVDWFLERGIPLSGINEVPGEENIIGTSRKPLFDLLIDDTALGSRLVYGEVEYASLDTGEIKRTRAYSIDWAWVERELIKRGWI